MSPEKIVVGRRLPFFFDMAFKKTGTFVGRHPPTQDAIVTTSIMKHFEVRESQPKPSFVTASGCGEPKTLLGGGFKYLLFSPLFGEMIHFD